MRCVDHVLSDPNATLKYNSQVSHTVSDSNRSCNIKYHIDGPFGVANEDNGEVENISNKNNTTSATHLQTNNTTSTNYNNTPQGTNNQLQQQTKQ